MPRSFQSTLLVAALLAGAGMLSAAPRSKPSGRIAGQVIGENGRPVAGARVIFQAADGTHPHAARADGKGRFRISLRPGLYDLRAQDKGQWSDWEHNVLVRNGRATNLTLRLTLKKPPDAPPRGRKPAQPSNSAPEPRPR
jgi:hypothetical protein